jgi:hypothetical protein
MSNARMNSAKPRERVLLRVGVAYKRGHPILEEEYVSIEATQELRNTTKRVLKLADNYVERATLAQSSPSLR